MNVTDFVPYHAKLIKLQAAQQPELAHVTIEQACVYANSGPAYTIVGDDGEILACGGFVCMWAGRAFVWTLLSALLTPALFVRINRIARKLMDLAPFRRIEAIIADGHAEGVRWAEMMGMRDETPNGMAGYAPDGRNYHLFARVR